MERTNRYVNIVFLTMLPLLSAAAQPDKQTLCPEVKVEAERLPDLTIPRASHETFCINGEYVVAGGHTNGFVPTPTAEYYRDGKWHTMQMVYTHDFGFSVVLTSGKILLAGGVEKNIGVGQTYTAEIYDPFSHTFNGFGSMEEKRAGASALELDSGKVVIAGNWYHDDGIEVYDGKRHFHYVKNASVQRATPDIFRISKDDALIIGRQDTRGETIHSIIADRLKGDSVSIPFLETWHLLATTPHRNADSFIGDEEKGLYTYLTAVQDSTGQVAIAMVKNGTFSLLPTTCPVPMHSQWEDIEYFTQVIVDRHAGLAYMMGISNDYRNAPEQAYRHYILCIDYARALQGNSAPLTLYYTDPIVEVASPVLTEDGDLLLAGGILNGSNFTPSASVYLLHMSHQSMTIKAGNSLWKTLWPILPILIGVTLFIYLFMVYRKKHRSIRLNTDLPETTATDADTTVIEAEADKILMNRICQLLEEQKLYQNSDLKVTDIATALGSNRRFVSDCINSQRGCSFTQFINGYRIDHAKHILRQTPNKKIADVYMEVGFSNEQSFFRTFKSITGMTPSEWKTKID